MWILHFLPDAFLAFIVDAVLWLGVVSTLISCFALKYLIRFLPTLSPHIRIVQIVSVALLLVGVYLKGGYSTEMIWRERVAEVEAKLKVAEAASQQVNERVVKQVVTKTQVIKEKGDVIVQQVEKLVPVEKDCAVPQEAIEVHNEAARMNRIIEQQRKARQ